MADKTYLAKQINRALRILAQTANLDEGTAMEIADLYEAWQTEKSYPVGIVLKYGVNKDNETQLYSVLQEHISQEDWTPDKTPALYKAIGFIDDIPIWTQPLGATDAYMKGDVVSHKDEIWISDIDGNVWEPGVYGWSLRDK